MEKPIVRIKNDDNQTGYTYKNCFVAYALGIPIEVETDLDEDNFSRFLDGEMSEEEIKKLFEMAKIS